MNKKAKLEGMALAVVLVSAMFIGAYLYIGKKTPAAITPIDSGGEPVETALKCSYAPTVQLSANNKHSAGQTNWGTWKYKLNGGGTTTDSDGSFEVPSEGIVDLQILVADGNSSSFYRALWNPSLHCGLNPLSYNNIVESTTFESKCYDEDGNPINGTTYVNNFLTIGSEGSRNVDCELQGVANKGMPYGGLMILEFNASTYKQEYVKSLTLGGAWENQKLNPEDSTPSAYTIGVAGGTTKTFKIPPIEDTGTYKWTISTLQAKSSINPATSNVTSPTTYGDGVYGNIYPINCYEEEDVSPTEFKCGIEDMDDTFTSPTGSTKALGMVTTFGINVD